MMEFITISAIVILSEDILETNLRRELERWTAEVKALKAFITSFELVKRLRSIVLVPQEY